MACSHNINYNPIHASTWRQDHITSWDSCIPTCTTGCNGLDDSDNDEFDGYIDLPDYTHSSINVHVQIQDETTDDQDISFRRSTFYLVTLSVSGTPVNNCLRPRGTQSVKLMKLYCWYGCNEN